MSSFLLKCRCACVFLLAFFRNRWGYRFASRAELMQFQENSLAQHRQDFWPRTTFYKSYIQKPESVPIMDKSLMMDRFDELNTVHLSKAECLDWALSAETSRQFSGTLNGVFVGLSSGTSAQRGVFLVTPIEQARWAGHLLAALLPRPFFKRQRVALFLRASSGLYENLAKSHWIQFKFFDLSRPFSDLMDDLLAFNPSIIAAPAQCLERLVQANTVKFDLQKVIAVAECLPDDVKAQVEAAWKLPVSQIYQATEGLLAVTCSHNRLHLNESAVHFDLEILDEASRRVVPIITDFARTSQLIVRYRLDDILILSEETHCPCGQHSLIIEKIEGRCDDVLQLPKLNGELTSVFPDFISRTLLNIEGLSDFRVRQNSDLSIQLQYSGLKVRETDISRSLTDLWQRLNLNADGIRVSLEAVKQFDITPMHKRRRIMGCAQRQL